MVKGVNKKQIVKIIYTNYKNETAERIIIPLELWFGSTEYHKEEQWLLKAFDFDKKAERNFAVKDIKSWMP
jgi:predicted DNA-binding transcriptional regulator YafY